MFSRCPVQRCKLFFNIASSKRQMPRLGNHCHLPPNLCTSAPCLKSTLHCCVLRATYSPGIRSVWSTVFPLVLRATVVPRPSHRSSRRYREVQQEPVLPFRWAGISSVVRYFSYWPVPNRIFENEENKLEMIWHLMQPNFDWKSQTVSDEIH